MRVDYSLYTLQGIHPRRGALLRFEFASGSQGYADCHPWEERGDDPLDQQLSLLHHGIFTPVTQQTLFFAQQDAEARQNRRSLFEGLTVPPSHFLVHLGAGAACDFREIASQGFCCCKIKISPEDENQIPALIKDVQQVAHDSFRIRLDANEQFSPEQWLRFSEKLVPMHSWMDFVEDPVPFDSLAWKTLQRDTGLKFACDRSSLQAIGDPDAAPFLVLKPAVQSPTPFTLAPKAQTILITSYLDHPLGQVQAAWIAAAWKKDSPERLSHCGLVSHSFYEANVFSRQLRVEAGSLIPPKGYGFGFDALLETQKWSPLSP